MRYGRTNSGCLYTCAWSKSNNNNYIFVLHARNYWMTLEKTANDILMRSIDLVLAQNTKYSLHKQQTKHRNVRLYMYGTLLHLHLHIHIYTHIYWIFTYTQWTPHVNGTRPIRWQLVRHNLAKFQNEKKIDEKRYIYAYICTCGLYACTFIILCLFIKSVGKPLEARPCPLPQFESASSRPPPTKNRITYFDNKFVYKPISRQWAFSSAARSGAFLLLDPATYCSTTALINS